MAKTYLKYLIEGLAYSFEDDNEEFLRAFNKKKIYDAYDILYEMNPDNEPEITGDLSNNTKDDLIRNVKVKQSFNYRGIDPDYSVNTLKEFYVVYDIFYIQTDIQGEYIQIKLERKRNAKTSFLDVTYNLKKNSFSIEDWDNDVQKFNLKNFRDYFPEDVAGMLDKIIRNFK